jgi:methionine-rich copper-binding protein CopC
MSRSARAALLAAVTVLAVLVPGRAAGAGAPILLGSDPAEGTTVAGPPPVARLWFSAEVTPRVDLMRLVDGAGRPVDGLRLAAVVPYPRVVVLDLPPLAPGVYGLSWHVVATGDGAAAGGVVVFAVGRPSANAEPAAHTVSGTASDLVVTVGVSPDRPGRNGVTILVASGRRPPPAPVDGVTVTRDTAPVPVDRVEPGRFTGSVTVAAPGPVRLTVVVHRASGDVAVPVEWAVPAPPAAPAGPPPPARPVTDLVVLVALAVLIPAGTAWLVVTRGGNRPWLLR